MNRTEQDLVTRDRGRDRLVWRLLTKLASSRRLGKKARVRLTQLEAKYGWKPSDDIQDEAIVYTSPVDMESTTRQFDSLSPEEAAELVESSNYSPLDGWDELSRQDPDRALAALEHLAADDVWPEARWRQFLFNAPLLDRERTGGIRAIERTISLLTLSPPEILEQTIHSICSLLRELSSDHFVGLEDLFYGLWDRSLHFARTQDNVIISDANSYEQAVAHPVGQLTAALFRHLVSFRHEEGKGIPDPLRLRLETLLRHGKTIGDLYGHYLVSSHLRYLYFLDKGWTEQHLLPLFHWSNPHAADLWNAFLYRPRFSPDLLSALTNDLVETVRRRSELPEQTRSVLLGLLVDLGIQAPGWLDDTTQRRLFNELDASELAVAASRLADLFDRENPGVLWREVVSPWFGSIWPMDKRQRSEAETESLAEIILATDDALPSSLSAIRPFLVPVGESSVPFTLTRQKSDVIRRYPEEVLELVDSLAPEAKGRGHSFIDLDGLLDLLLAAKPELETNFRYHRLRQFSLAG